MQKRKSFVFYESFYRALCSLPTYKDVVEWFCMICDYWFYWIEPDPENTSTEMKMLFAIAKPLIDSSLKRYDDSKKF